MFLPTRLLEGQKKPRVFQVPHLGLTRRHAIERLAVVAKRRLNVTCFGERNVSCSAQEPATFLRRRLGKCFEVIDVRGFRFISGARRGMKWENNEDFYRYNVRFGKIWPALTREVNVVMRKHARPVRNVHPASGYPKVRHL